MENNQLYHQLRNDILLNINTCFPARVLSFSDGKAMIQPLFKIKYYGQEPRTLPIIEGVPTLKQRYKVRRADAEYTEEYELVLRAGDVVLCVCAQRSLDDAMSGQPYYAGKSRILDIQDAVIVGVM